MKRGIEAYRDVVGDEIIDRIHLKASKFTGKHIAHVNSTFQGGGVAEILNSLILLMNDLDIITEWRCIKGTQDFFGITKLFHNSIQGGKINLSDRKKNTYLENNEINSIINHLEPADCVIIHDPQPLALIQFYKKKQPWVWRCHIDLTKPNQVLWYYLTQFIKKYDAMIVSMPQYKKGIVKEHIIPPAIDPFIPKNDKLNGNIKEKVLNKHGIPLDKPIISQVSRFDIWKDPLGVIDAYNIIKKKFDCRLVLVGNLATDDPEGPQIYNKVIKRIKGDSDIHIVMNSDDNDRLVNSIQTLSNVILQKSTKEGFALTVSEALWKQTPVIGGNVGGIPLQIKHGENGFLVNNVKECADSTLKLLQDPKLVEDMGKFGREHGRKNFLITRLLEDHLDLLDNLKI